MNKRTLHHLWTKLRWIKPWYFLVPALIGGVVYVLALRSNYQHMTILRDAVYSADQKNGDVQGSLRDLQAYVTTHMNANPSAGVSIYPPIQLKYTYERLRGAQEEALKKTNSSLYNDAQHYCEAQNSTDFSGRNRVPCIENYVQTHSSTQAPVLPAIPDALYKFAFVSPRWSSDLAGWSLVVTLLSSLAFVTTFALDQTFKKLLK